MIKRLNLRAALSLLLVLFSLPSAWAEKQFISGTSGPMWEYDSSTQTLTISGTGDMPDYTYEDATNSSNSNRPWENCYITNLVVESGITTIGNYSFSRKNELISVTLPNGLNKIGDYAFSENWRIETINIPNTVTYIGSYAFEYCYSLKSIVLPDELNFLGDRVFYKCNKLESATISGNVKSFGKGAFGSCGQLKTVVVNNGVESIGESAFSYCTDLSTLNLPNSLVTIESDAFNGCTSLTTLSLPNSLVTIESNAFKGCTSLTTLNIPDNVTSIGKNAFYHCSNLKSITLSNKLNIINNYAFSGCTSLEGIIIPASVNYIGIYAFSGCPALASISVDQNNSAFDSRDNCNAIIEKATSTLITGCRNTIIPSSVSQLGDTAFHGCSSLTTINIPSNISYFSDAFTDCIALTDVYCYANPYVMSWTSDDHKQFKPSKATMFHVAANDKATWETIFPGVNVTFVGDLENVEKLKYAVGEANSVAISVSESDLAAVSGEIVIPSSYTDGTNSYEVTAIAEDAFANCTNLTAVSIPSTITSIGSGAFAGCSSLNNIVVDANNAKYDSREDCNAIIETASNSLISGCKNTVIPSSVTSIGSKAFSGCVDLSSINIPSNVTSIGESAFKGCTALTSASLPSSLTSIAKEAFKGTGLTGISIPSNVTSIEESAFANCAALATASLPSGLTSIGESAFSGCTALTTASLPSGLTSIAKGAFKGTGLTTIEIPYSVKSVGESSFEGCSGLQSVTLPTDLAMIAKNTFLDCTSMTTVNIPVTVTKIEEGAFKNCEKLVAVTLPSGLVELGMSVFESSGLQSITLPPEVTAIAQKAFYSCRNLVSATLYAPQLTTYADDAFDENAANRKISVLSDYVDTYKSNWSKYTNDIVPISLTLNANPKNTAEKWCTYYNAAANVTVPAGVTIYKAQLDQANSKVMLSEVGGSIIAKGNAVMLKGSTSSINLSSAASAGSGDYTGNDLKGGTATPSTVAYTLAGINDVMGFYQFTGESLDPNKAHLEVAASNARSFIGFDSGTSTGVKLQTAADSSDQEWYTIDGRKLKGQPTQKGIYVKNGKKHVIK